MDVERDVRVAGWCQKEHGCNASCDYPRPDGFYCCSDYSRCPFTKEG